MLAIYDWKRLGSWKKLPSPFGTITLHFQKVEMPWRSAGKHRIANTGQKLPWNHESTFQHMRPVLLCCGWRWKLKLGMAMPDGVCSKINHCQVSNKGPRAKEDAFQEPTPALQSKNGLWAAGFALS
jgi:hypothetical protein